MARTLDIGQEHELLEKLEGAGMNSVLAQAVITSPDNSLGKRMVAWLVVAIRVVFTLVANIERDMIGWKCVEPVGAGEGEFEPVLREFLREGETFIGGEEMVKRAKEQGALTGLLHAEAMLREPEKIPVECRKFALVFPEVSVDPSGYRDVWYLDWVGVHWYLHYSWLDHDFNSNYRLVVSRKYQKPLGT